MNWGEFFSMGGYGDYVWSAYFVVAVTLIANVVVPLRSRMAVLRRLRAIAGKPTPAARQARAARSPRNTPRGATRTAATPKRAKPKVARKK